MTKLNKSRIKWLVRQVIKEGGWYYKDSYTGFFQSWGREVVWHNQKPFWTQIYGGGMTAKF